jgi:murein DD-endopeptidase MepM/ murein hydrolase activator NlpD
METSSWYVTVMAPPSSMMTLASIAALVWASPCTAQPQHKPLLLAPVQQACISSPFGPRVLPSQPKAGSYHYGIDLPAPEGAAVLATAPGTIIRIQSKGPGGLEMLVQHDGFVGIYSHLGKVMPAFTLGGKLAVAAGEKLGDVGNSGITTGPHLYFAMIVAGKAIDPASHLRVPLCNGEVRRILTDKPYLDGTIIGTLKHYRILLPVRQPYQLPQR